MVRDGDRPLVPTVGTVAEAAEGSEMRSYMKRMVGRDEGMSTAEYAVGTVAVAGLGGVLIKLLSSPEVRDLIWSVLTQALSSFTG